MNNNSEQPPKMVEVFNEQKLRAGIVEIWGEYGAHVEVFDFMLNKVRALDLLEAAGHIKPGKLEEAKSIVAQYSKPIKEE